MQETEIKLDEFLKNHMPLQRHSYFQMKYLILGKQPTIQGKMWQCLRELRNLHENSQALELEIEETKDNIELIQCDIEDTLKENDKRKSIMARKYARKQQALKQSLVVLNDKKNSLKEEIEFYFLAFQNLNKHKKYVQEDNENAQLEFWTENLSQKLNMRLLLQDKIDIDIAESIFALPANCSVKQQLVSMIEQKQLTMLKQKQENEKITEEN